jgi:hypothetical protein
MNFWAHIISWLILGIPSLLLINCCLYAGRIARGEGFLTKRSA